MSRFIKSKNKVEIDVAGLQKSFHEHQVLRGVDLEIHQGELVAIIGGSGCGKTVLLNSILGLLPVETGIIKIIDHDKPGKPIVEFSKLDEADIDRTRAHWGVVFQNNALFSGTVYDNLELWLREVKNLEDDEIKPIAQSVLEAVDLPSDAPFMETETASLSGGMAKRLAVARALSMDPSVIFYDEPTTGLDPTSAALIQDLILTTHEVVGAKRTTVIITHDKDLLIRLQPRIIMLHEGRVFFDGTFDAFATSESPVIRPYFDLMPVLHQRAIGY